MRKTRAYGLMVLIVAALAAMDYLLLTTGGALSRIARRALEKMFGESLDVRKVGYSLDGVLTLEDVQHFLGAGRLQVASAERVEMRFVSGRASPQSILLEGARISLSGKFFEELAREKSGKPLREQIKAEDLPRVVCRGGAIEALFPELFPGVTQEMAIREVALTPVGGYRYHVGGTLESVVFGAWNIFGEFDLDTGEQHLRISAPGLVVGKGMREPLAPALRAIYDRYRPEGRCDVTVFIDQEPGGDLDFRINLQARDMTLVYENFPYRVDRVAGEIDFLKKGFRIKYMTARHGEAKVRFDGAASGYEAESDYAFRLEIDDMELDAEVRAAIDKDGQGVWDQFAPRGRADVRGRVLRDAGPGKPGRVPLDITFRDATVCYREFPYELRNVAGEVRIDGSDVQIKDLTSREGDAVVRIAGRIGDISGDATVDLSIDAKGFPLDARLRGALKGETLKLWDDFSPAGPVDVLWRVRREKGKEVEHTAVARARGNTVTWKEIPLPASEVEGEIELAPGVVRLRHVTGKMHGAQVRVHGVVLDDVTTLQVDAVALPVDDEVKNALPKGLSGLLKSLRLSGLANFRSGLTIRKNGERKVELDLKLSKGVIDTEPRFEELLGNVWLVGWFGEETHYGGFLHFSQGTVMGKRMTDISSSVNGRGSRINFVNIKAGAYGGVVTSPSFSLDHHTGDFAGSFFIDRMDLREYTLDTQGYAQKALAGKASLELRDLAGKTGNAATFVGKGKLSIRDGLLWDIPFFAKLFTLNLQDLFNPSNRFDAGIIDFELKDRQFLVEKLGFTSESVSLIGKGRIGFDGNLNLMLRPETKILGIDFLPLNIIAKTFDILKSPFHGVEVTGTFDKPVVSQKFFPGN